MYEELEVYVKQIVDVRLAVAIRLVTLDKLIEV